MSLGQGPPGKSIRGPPGVPGVPGLPGPPGAGGEAGPRLSQVKSRCCFYPEFTDCDADENWSGRSGDWSVWLQRDDGGAGEQLIHIKHIVTSFTISFSLDLNVN